MVCRGSSAFKSAVSEKGEEAMIRRAVEAFDNRVQRALEKEVEKDPRRAEVVEKINELDQWIERAKPHMSKPRAKYYYRTRFVQTCLGVIVILAFLIRAWLEQFIHTKSGADRVVSELSALMTIAVVFYVGFIIVEKRKTEDRKCVSRNPKVALAILQREINFCQEACKEAEEERQRLGQLYDDFLALQCFVEDEMHGEVWRREVPQHFSMTIRFREGLFSRLAQGEPTWRNYYHRTMKQSGLDDLMLIVAEHYVIQKIETNQEHTLQDFEMTLRSKAARKKARSSFEPSEGGENDKKRT